MSQTGRRSLRSAACGDLQVPRELTGLSCALDLPLGTIILQMYQLFLWRIPAVVNRCWTLNGCALGAAIQGPICASESARQIGRYV